MCFETLLWLQECCCTWMLNRPQKEEDRARGVEGLLTSGSKSSRLSRSCTSKESVLIAA
jgi:hypothetical protein